MTVSRPDRVRFEIERSDGEKGLVIFDGKEITVYTAKKNVYATVSKPGTLDEAIKYASPIWLNSNKGTKSLTGP